MTDSPKDRAHHLAEDIQRKHGGYICSWKDINPSESTAASQLVREQLRLENIPVLDEVFEAVFRWRMMEALRYQRRKQHRSEQGKSERSSSDVSHTKVHSISSTTRAKRGSTSVLRLYPFTKHLKSRFQGLVDNLPEGNIMWHHSVYSASLRLLA